MERFKTTLLATGIFIALFLLLPRSGLAQCTWGLSSQAPPSASYLRSYRASFHAPARLAVDGAGYVYITEPRTGRIVVRDPYGRSSSVVEGFSVPLGIAADGGGRIYVAEQGTGSVSVYDHNWNPLRFLGVGAGEFGLPSDIAIDSGTGEIYVSDSKAHMIKVYSSSTGGLVRSFGGQGSGAGQFNFPTGVYVTPFGVEVYVADQTNNRIQVFDRNGVFQRCFLAEKSSWFNPTGVGLEGLTGDSQGRLYVADAFQGHVAVFDLSGLRLSTIGSFGDGRGQLRTPMDAAIDPYNRLIITSANTSRVEVFGIDSYTDPNVIEAVVDVTPDTVKLGQGKSLVSAYIELPGYSLDQVDVTRVTANGAPGDPASAEIGDHDGDGIPDLKIDFDQNLVFAGMANGDVPVIVSGYLMTMEGFEGVDTVHLQTVTKGGGKK